MSIFEIYNFFFFSCHHQSSCYTCSRERRLGRRKVVLRSRRVCTYSSFWLSQYPKEAYLPIWCLRSAYQLHSEWSSWFSPSMPASWFSLKLRHLPNLVRFERLCLVHRFERASLSLAYWTAANLLVNCRCCFGQCYLLESIAIRQARWLSLWPGWAFK